MKIIQTVREEWSGKNRGGWIIVLGLPLALGIVGMTGNGLLMGIVAVFVVVIGAVDSATHSEHVD